MNITYVVDMFPKTSETFIANEVEEHINNNHNVNVLSLEKTPNKIDIKIKKVNYLDKISVKKTSLVDMIKLYPELITFVIDKENRYWIKCAYFFSKFCGKTEIIHAQFAGNNARIAFFLSKMIGVPFVLTMHSYDLFSPPSRKRLIKIMKYADKLIVPSYKNRSYIIDNFKINPEKISVIRACARKNKLKKEKKPKEILTVSRLTEKKGIIYLIEAIRIIKNKKPDIKLIIIGDGELRKGLEKKTKERGLHSNIKFLGEMQGREIQKHLKKAAIFALPCITASNKDVDICPLSIQEAMRAGVPVITTKAGSIPELITEKEGFIVKEKSPEEIAKAIERIMKNNREASIKSEKAKKKVERDFDITKEVEKLEEIYKNLIKND